MSALALHDFAPLLASGARRQQARLFTNSGEPVADLRGEGGARVGPVSALAFHPHRLFLGVGTLDATLAVYQGAV
jgi:regulator-associated protein of mTOR